MDDNKSTRSLSSNIKRMLNVRARSSETGRRSSGSERSLFVDAGPDITPAIISRLQKAKVSGASRADLVGLVLPPGHGKTYFAKRYGWIDIDSLIRGDKYQEVYEAMANKLTSERDWIGSMSTLAEEAAGVLNITCHRDKAVVLLQCEHQAAYLGIRVLGSYVLDDDTVLKSIPADEVFRKQLALLGSAVAREMGAEEVTSRIELEELIISKLTQAGVKLGAQSAKDRKQWQSLMRGWSPSDIIGAVAKNMITDQTAMLWTGNGAGASGCRLMMSDDWVMLQMSDFGSHPESVTVPHFERRNKGMCFQGLANV
ncbi:RNA-dependent RNA polymerase, partial [viral metagenome]